jgi:HAD superfamily hydrolase (TIGR01662 family)
LTIRGIVFDLGNTLMYWEGDDQERNSRANSALVLFLSAHGIDVGEDFLPLFHAARADGWKVAEETNMEHTVEEALKTVLDQLGHTCRNGLLTRAADSFFMADEAYQRAYPEVLETLGQLKASGLHVGLISNADDDGLVQRAVVHLGMAPFIDPIVSSAGLKWRKPNPRIFHYVADRWGLPADQIAMVGDAPKYDILGAHNAGMKGILVDRGEGHWWQQIPEEFKNDPSIQPDLTVHNLTEITHKLQEKGH